MPLKGIFVRFNGFSHRGWYQYTTFLFRRLKSPENALKRSLGIFTIFLTIDLTRNPFKLYISKTPFKPPPKECPQRAFLAVLTAFLRDGGINIPLFDFDGLNRLKTPLNAVLVFLQEVLTRVTFKIPFQESFSKALLHS